MPSSHIVIQDGADPLVITLSPSQDAKNPFSTIDNNVSSLGTEMEAVNFSTSESGTPIAVSAILDLYARSASISSTRSTGTADTGDTVMEQGALGGPPVSEWVFDPDIQNSLDNHNKWCDKHYAHPSGPRLAEEQEIYCECNGTDDSTPMIKCDNESTCLKEWFHMRCVGMEPPGPTKGQEWYCRRCLYFERGSVKAFKYRMGLPFTKEILAADKARAWKKISDTAEAGRLKNEKVIKLPVATEVGNKLEELKIKENAQRKAPISEVDLLALTTDPAARAALFSITADVPSASSTQSSRKKKKPKKKESRKPADQTSELSTTPDQLASDSYLLLQENDRDDEVDEPQSPEPLLANQQQSPYETRFKPQFLTGKSWSGAEENACIAIMRTLLLRNDQLKLTVAALFDKAAEEMKKIGYDRAAPGIRMYWTRHLREATGLDERKSIHRGGPLQTSVQTPRNKNTTSRDISREAASISPMEDNE